MEELVMKLIIDAGHGGTDPGAVGPTGLKEKDITLKLAAKVGDILKNQGVSIGQTRTTDVFVELDDRAAIANNANAEYFLSIHINSAGSPAATGTETYAYKAGGTGEKLAAAIQQRLVAAIGLPNRGVKFANFAVLRETNMPASLVEVCFICNPAEEAMLKQEAFLNKVAKAISLGFLDFIDQAYQEPQKEEPIQTGTSILGAASATVCQAKAWAKAKGASDVFITLADIFWKLSPTAGVNPVVAYCQSAKETGYGKFGGVIDESYKNPCGLKKTEGGGDYDKEAHQRFASWDEGIQAQLDHLALYAGASGYPKTDTPDPRHFAFIAGTAKTVEALGGKWAPSTTYGQDIVKMMVDLKATNAPAEKTPIEITIDNALADGGITARDYWTDVLEGKEPANPQYLKQAFDNYHAALTKQKG